MKYIILILLCSCSCQETFIGKDGKKYGIEKICLKYHKESRQSIIICGKVPVVTYYYVDVCDSSRKDTIEIK